MTRKAAVLALALLVPLSACSAATTTPPAAVPSGVQPPAVVRIKGLETAPTLPTVTARAGDLPTNTFTTPTYTTPPPPTTPPPTTPPPIPSDILFDTASSVLKPSARPYLTTLCRQIQARYPGAHLTFVGYTDSRGDNQNNLTLSADRAQAVLSVFAANRYPTQKMTAVGRGEQQPLVPDTDSKGNFLPAAGEKNRRVQIQIFP